MSNYHYIDLTNRDFEWGLAVNSVGCETYAAGTDYPSKGHPVSHYYSPQKGRTLPDYGIVYITDGEVFFQSEHFPLTKLIAGTAVLFFPGEWHNYYPHPDTGASHMWMHFNGPDMDKRMKSGFISVEKPISAIGIQDDVIKLFTEAINISEQKPENYQIMLAGIVNHLLGYVCTYNRTESSSTSVWEEKVNRARMIMLRNVETSISAQDIAAQISVSYSAFRMNFKRITGVSPGAYFQNLKIQRAIDLLRNSSLSIKEIAYMLNFNSWDNFCSAFKQRTGKRPSDFR